MRLDVDALSESFRRFPESEIVFCGKGGLRNATSYQDFGLLVRDKVDRLWQAGVSPRSRIGVLAGNSFDFMTWDLALVMADCVSVVFTDDHRASPPQDLLRQYGCVLLLHDQPQWEGRGLARIEGSAALDLVVPELVPQDDPDLLTMVFSSGTTGRQKGLRISRRGTAHIIGQFIDAYAVDENERYYSFLPFSYFQQRALYYAALSCGASVVVGHPDNFAFDLRAEKPTYTINPPIFYQAIHGFLTAGGPSGATNLREFLGGRINWMITAMAPIDRRVLDYYWENGVRLFETYAVTETGLIAWNTPLDYKIGTVGKPAGDNELVMTEEGEILCKRKFPVALGYFDAAGEDETRVFREDGAVATGDIGAYDQDGFITLIGRTKSAIVTGGGKKFHPEQIERFYLDQGGCGTPIVVGGADVGQNLLLLFSSEAIDPGKVREVCGRANECFPSHMQIGLVVVSDRDLDNIPEFHTRNMKVDRNGIVHNIDNIVSSGRKFQL